MSAEAIEQHLGLAVWHAIVIFIRDKIKIRQRHHPHPTETDLDAAHILEFVVKYDPLVMPTVAVGVLENDNAIVQARLLVRIILRLRHPQPPAVIEAKPNRLRDSWLARKERHVKPLRHLHRPRRLNRRKRFLNHRLARLYRRQ